MTETSGEARQCRLSCWRQHFVTTFSMKRAEERWQTSLHVEDLTARLRSQFRIARLETVLLQDEACNQPVLLFGNRTGIGGGHLLMLEVEEILNRFAIPHLVESGTGQGGPHGAGQVRPMTFSAMVVECDFTLFGLLGRKESALCRHDGSGDDAKKCDREPKLLFVH